MAGGGTTTTEGMNVVLSLRAVAFSVALLASGCSSPQVISNNPLGQLPGAGTVQTGLVNAAFNLNSAIKIGVLPATDPAAACINQTLTLLGIDPTTGQPVAGASTFTPKVTDLISLGSVAYILAQQALPLANGGLQVPAQCEALIGKLVVDAARAQASALNAAGAIGLLVH